MIRPIQPDNKYIVEFENTIKTTGKVVIPPGLHKVSSFWDRDARDFFAYLSILYSKCDARGKKKITWAGKRYERAEEREKNL